jgi:hypothetical protein
MFIIFSRTAGMLMEDPIPTFSYLVQSLRDSFPNLGYLHIVEPRTKGPTSVEWDEDNRHQSERVHPDHLGSNQNLNFRGRVQPRVCHRAGGENWGDYRVCEIVLG